MSSEPSREETSRLLPNPSTIRNQNPHNEANTHHTRKSQTALWFQVTATMYSFAVLGLFSSSTGALLGSLSSHYKVSVLRLSLIFLVGPLFYVVAAQSNSMFHSRFGQMGVASMGPVFHILAAGILAVHPPFPVLLVAFGIAAAGTGLLDGSWCAWAATTSNANTISGLLQGSFSVGAAVGPFLVATMMSALHTPWYEWYYVLTGASLLELVVLVVAFRDSQTASGDYESDDHVGFSSYKDGLYDIFSYRATCTAAAYFLSYVGTETTISMWIFSFMSGERDATLYQAGLSSTVFWAGMAVGRFCLGPVTDKAGVGMATVGYLLCGLAIEVLFVVVRSPVASIVLMMFLGILMGPLYPSGVVLLTQNLPKPLHIQAVSLIAAVGQVGAAVFPYGIGALVHGLGIFTFPYALVVFLGLTLSLWIAFARLQRTTTGAVLEEHVQASG